MPLGIILPYLHKLSLWKGLTFLPLPVLIFFLDLFIFSDWYEPMGISSSSNRSRTTLHHNSEFSQLCGTYIENFAINTHRTQAFSLAFQLAVI